MDSKIKFSVEGLQTLRDEMQKVYRDSVAQSKLLLDNNKEFISILQTQIKLLQTRQDLLGVSTQNTNNLSNISPGNITRVSPIVPQRNQPIDNIPGLREPGTDIPITRTQDQIKLTLRQLSQAILDQKRIVEDVKMGIEASKTALNRARTDEERREAKSDLSADKRSLTEETSKLKELQRQREQAQIDLRGSSKEQRDPNFRPSLIQGLGVSMLVNPLNSQDPVQGAISMGQNLSTSMMGVGGKMGLLGVGLGIGVGIAGAQVSMLKEVMPAAARMARLRGGSIDDYLEKENAFAEIGFKRKEVLENRAEAISALGRDSASNLSTMLALQRGFDVSQGDLVGLMRAGRGDKNFDLQRIFSSTYTGLQYAGLGKEKTEAFIPEYLKILTELGQRQLETLGKVDFGINTKMLTFISSAGERLQNPDTARNALNQMYQGLTSAQTPQVEALQFQALSRAFPGKSLWQLEKVREEPFSKEGMRYVELMMQNIKEVSSGRDDLERNISIQWNLGKNIASEVANLFDKPGGIPQIQKLLEENKGLTEQDVYKRAIGTTDKFDALAAKWEQLKWGELTNTASDVLDKMSRLLSWMDSSSRKTVINPESVRGNSVATIGASGYNVATISRFF